MNYSRAGADKNSVDARENNGGNRFTRTTAEIPSRGIRRAPGAEINLENSVTSYLRGPIALIDLGRDTPITRKTQL